MKKSLITGIILIIISLSLVIYSEFINNRVNINEITNNGLKEENKKVYLNATFIAGTITDNYYVIFGDGVQYIVYMDNSIANKINRYLLDYEESSYRIEGITKLIPKTLEENGKKFVNEWLVLNHNHDGEEDHSHDITTDEFYHYFGYVYLDSTVSFNLIKIIIYITSITGILFILNNLNSKYHFI